MYRTPDGANLPIIEKSFGPWIQTSLDTRTGNLTIAIAADAPLFAGSVQDLAGVMNPRRQNQIGWSLSGCLDIVAEATRHLAVVPRAPMAD